jgi:hypothetical protein
MRQIQVEVVRFGGTVQDTILLIQDDAIDQAIQDALDLMRASLPPLPTGVTQTIIDSFGNLHRDAVREAAGLLGPDSPLAASLSESFGESVAGQVEEHILDGIVQGKNPRAAAKAIVKNIEDSFGIGLRWAMTTVRTAQIKSYQLANHATYQANAHLVPEWEWHAALDDRTCLSCISKHGTLHPVTEILRDHHSGRCAPLPVPISYAALGITGVKEPARQRQTGREWFDKLAPAKQRAMMGAGRYAAWQKKEFDFADLSKSYDDQIYGQLFREASLKDLLGEKAKEYYVTKK